MSNNTKPTDKIINILKERWWLSIVLIIIIVLYLIPAYTGLPGDNYRGCEGDSKCQNTPIKSINKLDNGTSDITVTAKITSTKNEDLTFNVPKGSSYAVGDNVFMNYSPSIHEIVYFIARRTSLLYALTIGSITTPGPVAAVDTNTGKPVTMGP